MSDDLISRQEAIRWVKTECNPYGKPTLEFESGKKVIEHLEQMPSAQSDVHDRNVGEWDMFDLITSAYYGKTMYSKYSKLDNGIVYSRYSGKYMSMDEAIREFLAVIGEDRE